MTEATIPATYTPTDRWEYLFIDNSNGAISKAVLNSYGEDRWELIQWRKDILIFKRPVYELR